MAIQKYQTAKGARWRASLWEGKERLATKGGFKTKKDAQIWHDETKRNWNAPISTDMGFRDLVNAYLDEVADRRQGNTYIYKKSTYTRAADVLGKATKISHIQSLDIAAFLKERKESAGPKAANRDLGELKTLVNWGIRKNYCQTNPFRSFDPYPEEKFIRYVPPAEDIAAVRMAATQDERDVIDTLYFSACRLSELCRMKWDDINFQRGTLTLWTRKRRAGSLEPRTVAMPEALNDLLYRRWQNRSALGAHGQTYAYVNPETGKPMTRHNAFLRLLFSRLVDRVNASRDEENQIQYFTAHCIRHHVATLFLDSRKATPRQIQQFLGHKNQSTTEVYLHELDVDRSIVEAFEIPQNKKQRTYSAHEGSGALEIAQKKKG